jgi:hypothetical protein
MRTAIELLLGTLVGMLIGVWLMGFAHAGAPETWMDSGDPQINEWFPTVMMPPGNRSSCCGKGDAFYAENVSDSKEFIRVRIPQGRGIVPDGAEFDVSKDHIQVNYGNPTGKIVVFIGDVPGYDDYEDPATPTPPKQVICYIPMEGA